MCFYILQLYTFVRSLQAVLGLELTDSFDDVSIHITVLNTLLQYEVLSVLHCYCLNAIPV